MTKMLERNWQQFKEMAAPTILNELVAMDISPAAKWFLAESDKEYWSLTTDFPCVMTPSSFSWLEFDLPPVIRSGVRQQSNHGGRSIAAMIITLEIPEEERMDCLKEDGLREGFMYYLKRTRNTDGIVTMYTQRPTSIAEALERGQIPKWLTFWQLLGEPIAKQHMVPYANYGFYLDDQGGMIKDLGISNLRIEDVDEHKLKNSFADALPFLFALSLTHCRNVEITERQVPPAVRKKRAAKGIPEIRFKQLTVKPMGKQATTKGEGSRQPHGWLPMHFVRAHFRNYSEEKPLFGKYSGRYFVGLHTRGKAEHGTVNKQYVIKQEDSNGLQEEEETSDLFGR